MSELIESDIPEKEETSLDLNKEVKGVSKNSRKHFKYRSNECLNCSQPLDLSDRYCPYCSQLNSTKPLSLLDFFEEFLSSIISYDSKLRFTVKDLLFKPGTITRNYVSGKRLKYSNPFRFFLSVSIIYFLLQSVITFFNPQDTTPLNDIDFNNTESIEASVQNNLIQNNSDEEIQEAIKELEANPVTAKFAEQLKTQDSIQKAEVTDNIQIKGGDTINKTDYQSRIKHLSDEGKAQGFVDKINLFRDFYKESKISSAEKALDSLHLEKSRMNLWLYNKNASMDRVEKNPADLIQFVLSKTPFFLFFFAPFFALFFWLVLLQKAVWIYGSFGFYFPHF